MPSRGPACPLPHPPTCQLGCLQGLHLLGAGPHLAVRRTQQGCSGGWGEGWSFGVYRYREVQDKLSVSACVCVCVTGCAYVFLRLDVCVCIHPFPELSKENCPPPILVMALLFRCPSWGGGSWGSPADRGRKRMTLSAHQRMWAGGAGCLCKRGELCTCRTPASPVAPAHLGAPRARDERCQGVPPSRRGSHRAGW